MKYYGKTAILIPYIKDDDTPDWIRIQLVAPEGIDRRKLLRSTRIFLKQNFGKKVSNDFVRRCCMIVNQHDTAPRKIWDSPDERREFMDRLVLSIQEGEDQHEAQAAGYSISEAEATEEAELEVSSLQGEPTSLPTV